MTAIYTTALAIGLTAAFTLTVPFSEALATSSWRLGLGAGGTRGRGGPAVVPAAAARPHRHADPWPSGAGRLERRCPGPGWAGRWRCSSGSSPSRPTPPSAGSPRCVRDSGYSATTAGLLVAILAGASIPTSLLVPWLAGRRDDQRAIVAVLVSCYAVGYLGLGIFRADSGLAVGPAPRDRRSLLPVGPHHDRAAQPHPGGHRGAVGLHPVGRLPVLRDRAVRHRP